MNEQMMNLFGNQFSGMQIDALKKALEILPGTAGVNAPAGTIDTWKPEMMSAIQTTLYAQQADLKFSRALFTDPTNSTFYQYRRETELGKTDIFGAHSSQSGMPQFANPAWDRGNVTVCLHHELADSSMLAQSQNFYGAPGQDLLGYITERKMLAMLIRENRIFMRGNQNLDPLMPSGILQLHKKWDGVTELTPKEYAAKEQVIDLRNRRLNFDDINKADRVLVANFDSRNLRALWMPQVAIEGLTSQALNNTLIYRQEGLGNGAIINNTVAGVKSTGLNTIMFNYDIFIDRHPARHVMDANETISTTAPAVPNVSSGTNASIADTDSKFITSDAGTYYYGVCAVGSGGISKMALINATPATIAAAGNSINLKFVDGAGANVTTGYIIYRGLKNGLATDLLYPIIEISTTQLANGYDEGGATVVRDKNRIIPGTHDAIMVSVESDGYTLAKDVVRRVEFQNHIMNGFVRFQVPMAVSAPSVQAKLLHGYALAHPAPPKMIVFRNIQA